MYVGWNPIKTQCIKIALQNELNVIVLANKRTEKKFTRFDVLSWARQGPPPLPTTSSSVILFIVSECVTVSAFRIHISQRNKTKQNEKLRLATISSMFRDLHVCVHWYNEIHVNPCHKRRRTMRMEKANRTRFFLFLTSLLETSLFQLDVPSLMMDVGRHSRRKYFCRPRSGSNYFGCVDCRSSEEIFSG